VSRSRPAPAPDLASDRAAALELVPVSRETAVRLDRFVELLLQRQSITNLIAPSTVPQLWTRHIADSLQLVALAPEARTWIDLGSGGGFPGLVIACALADQPGARIHLVESTMKKAAFLREAATTLAVPAVVHACRIEDFIAGLHDRVGHDRVDIVTARALAPLNILLTYVAPLLKTPTRALLPKGRDVEVELTAASRYWNIEATLVPSKTSADSRVMIIRQLQRLDRKG
jgi:16S rRNA (guanine527-N7)-methyltransferase